MDAVEFLKEYRRMCNKYIYSEACGEDCSCECALYGKHCNLACEDMSAEEVVSKVKQWSQSHPQKTMMQDFFEKFPNALKRDNGTPQICPQQLGYGDFCCEDFEGSCLKCWSRPLEE